MRVAALDLGSHTSLLTVADMRGSEMERVLHDESTVTKLGQGVHAARAFHPEALARMDACFGRYAQTIRHLDVHKVIAVATSAARDVTNGEALVALGRKYGIPVHIIDGAREAALTYRGALSDRADADGVAVIDVGGGSTEVIGQTGGALRGTSVDIGSVRLTELFITEHPTPAVQLEAVREYARERLRRAPLPRGSRQLVAVSGTPTTLAALDLGRAFDEHLVQGYRLDLEVIEHWAARLAAMGLAEREALPGMQPKRADVIVAGALILAATVRDLNHPGLTVSTRGVRYGVALAWQEF